MCVTRDKCLKVGTYFSFPISILLSLLLSRSLIAYINISLTCTYVVCTRHRCVGHCSSVCTYIHTYRDTEIPIHIDARSTNTPLQNEVRRDLPYRPLWRISPLLKLSIIPGRDLISRDNVAARTNVYTCARNDSCSSRGTYLGTSY